LSGDLSKIRLVIFDFDGVFTDNAVYVDQNGVESVRCWRGDGLGLEALRQLGIEMAVVSTETNPVVETRCKKLQIRCISGSNDKATAVKTLCKSLNIALSETCFLGNDRNDLPALNLVGYPAIVADADESVSSEAFLKTSKPGGFGAVRELCDMISAAITKQSRMKS